MIDSSTQRRQLRDEIARLRRRIDRRVAPLVQSGRWMGIICRTVLDWCCPSKPDDCSESADSNER